ncbi:probable glutamate receptor [Penaeus chinensis]|uniref:probable glutamate receptor n=1 Tax=Penaeus chinensis TaxID=139456 RepID=UPI001FB6E0E1|nr:probable glutamate receptor [Penaeus chinensis]
MLGKLLLSSRVSGGDLGGEVWETKDGTFGLSGAIGHGKPEIFAEDKRSTPQGHPEVLPTSDDNNGCALAKRSLLPRYSCYRVEDGQWGSVVNGEWTGLIRDVYDGRADIAVGPLSVTRQRSDAVDFLIALMASSYRIVVKRPTNEDYMWTVYTKQFQSSVWVIILALSTSEMLSLYLVSHRSSQEYSISFADSAFATVGTLFGQGRTVMLTSLLLQSVALTFYTSTLVSALTVGPPLPPYKDLQALYKKSSLKLAFLKGGTQLEYIKQEIQVSLRNVPSCTDPLESLDAGLYQLVWQSVTDEELVESEYEGVAKALRGKHAYLAWEIFFRLRYGGDCRLIELPVSYFPDYASFAVAKDSPLVPVLNKIILDMLSGGLPKKWWGEFSGQKTDCTALESGPVELKTVITAFLLITLGIVISLAILSVECYQFSRARTPN